MFLYLAISSLTSLTTWILVLLPNFLLGKGWSSQKIGWHSALSAACPTVHTTPVSVRSRPSGSIRCTRVRGLSLYLASSALGMFVGSPIWGAIVDRGCSDVPDCGAVDRRGHLRLCGCTIPLETASGPDGRGRTPKGVVLPAFKTDS